MYWVYLVERKKTTQSTWSPAANRWFINSLDAYKWMRWRCWRRPHNVEYRVVRYNQGQIIGGTE